MSAETVPDTIAVPNAFGSMDGAVHARVCRNSEGVPYAVQLAHVYEGDELDEAFKYGGFEITLRELGVIGSWLRDVTRPDEPEPIRRTA